MRKLNAGDLFKAGKMLAKALPQLAKIDFVKQDGEDEKAHARRIGGEVLPLLLDTCYDDAWAFLASVNDMTVDEFNQQALDFPLQTAIILAEQEDLRGFFRRAAGLMSGSPSMSSPAATDGP